MNIVRLLLVFGACSLSCSQRARICILSILSISHERSRGRTVVRVLILSLSIRNSVRIRISLVFRIYQRLCNRHVDRWYQYG